VTTNFGSVWNVEVVQVGALSVSREEWKYDVSGCDAPHLAACGSTRANAGFPWETNPSPDEASEA
jgi:hypothetical protein